MPEPNDIGKALMTISPDAVEVFWQGIYTRPIDGLTEARNALLSGESSTAGGSSQREGWKSLRELQRMNDPDLERLRSGLKAKLERDSLRAKKLQDIIKEKEEEVDWVLRIGEGEEEEEDDLFGDEKGADGGKAEEGEGKTGEESVKPLGPNPREGWAVDDYLRYMDSGLEPPPNKPPPEIVLVE